MRLWYGFCHARPWLAVSPSCRLLLLHLLQLLHHFYKGVLSPLGTCLLCASPPPSLSASPPCGRCVAHGPGRWELVWTRRWSAAPRSGCARWGRPRRSKRSRNRAVGCCRWSRTAHRPRPLQPQPPAPGSWRWRGQSARLCQWPLSAPERSPTAAPESSSRPCFKISSLWRKYRLEVDKDRRSGKTKKRTNRQAERESYQEMFRNLFKALKVGQNNIM